MSSHPPLFYKALLENLSAKICHDFAGPVTGIHSAVELLEEEGDAEMKGQALNLASASSGQIINKLKTLRFAYGYLKSSSVQINEIQELVQDYFIDTKLKFIWKVSGGGDIESVGLPGDFAKFFINIILTAICTLPFGGEVEIVIEEKPDCCSFSINMSGEKIKYDEEYGGIIASEGNIDKSNVAVNAHNVQEIYTRFLADSLRIKLMLSKSHNQIKIFGVYNFK